MTERAAQGDDVDARAASGAPAAPPAMPTAEELADLHPASDPLYALLDVISERAVGQPVRPRWKLSPAGLLRGEIDRLKLEVPGVPLAGLVLDRLIVEAERVRVSPGLPPCLVAEPVRLTAVVSQERVDRWVRTSRLPVRLRLSEEGIVITAGLAGFRMSELVTELAGEEHLLRLRPVRASMLGVSAPLVGLLRGYLPLPPLPRDAKLESVQPAHGEYRAHFVIDRFEQSLDPRAAGRLSRLLPIRVWRP